MTWQCVPEESDPTYPDAEPVLFRFAADPAYFVLAFGRGLCHELQASGKTTAAVTFEVWGPPAREMRGYRIEWINGKPLQNAGGMGRSGWQGTGDSGPHPLTNALQ
jgi:hypothetical protein